MPLNVYDDDDDEKATKIKKTGYVPKKW